MAEQKDKEEIEDKDKEKEIHTFYYFNNKNYPINVTNDTVKYTGATFSINGELWENASMLKFFELVVLNTNTNTKINIIDVGAQSGLYSLFIKHLKNTHIYSFEPFPLSFKLLNDNIKLNNLDETGNIETFQMGISNTKEKKILNVCKSHNGLHTLGSGQKRFKDTEKIEVEIEVDTIDNLFYNQIRVHFIKIDTEGWELHVLEGAIETIKKYRPIIQVEWSLVNMSQCNINENQLIDFLDKLEYKRYDLTGEEAIYIPKEIPII